MNIEAQLAVCLIVGNLMGDFALQSLSRVLGKKRIAIVSLHTFITTAVTYVVVGDWSFWQLPVLIFVTHFVIDYINQQLLEIGHKEAARGWHKHLRSWLRENRLALFSLERAVHIAVLFTLAFLVFDANGMNVYWVSAYGQAYLQVLLFISGLIVAIRVGEIITMMIVKPLQPKKAGDKTVETGDRETAAMEQGIVKGGAYIGRLERFLVYILVLLGRYETIGFLLTAKSILRFGRSGEGELRSEYVIIGTLTSVAVALVSALIVIYFQSINIQT